MRKYYIYSPPYCSTSGGILALHRLAHNLTLLGQEAYIVADSYNDEWLGIRMQHNELKDPNGVSIYPEIVDGNPFGTKTVVRWLLNTPGVLGGNGIYADSDLVYKYANYFKAPNETKVRGELRALDLQLERFVNQGVHQPGKVCYMARKGAYKPQNQHPTDALCIDDYGSKGGHDYLVKIFAECETFISYDHANFACALAALAGCTVIVIPDGELSAEKWKAKFPYFSYGIAYGHEDVTWSRETRKLVGVTLQQLEIDTLNQTEQLINDCNDNY